MTKAMLAISAELLHGTIRATSFEDTSITGEDADGDGAKATGEWPPSPARLFSALVAGGGTSVGQHLTDARELRLLERAAPPRILASPRNAVLHSRLRPRYVVVNRDVKNKTKEAESVQEYVTRTAIAVRPGTRLAPACATVTYVWDDVSVDDEVSRALSLRAARVGYLGCSDSPVKLAVSTEPVEGDSWWVPSEDGTTVLPVPYAGFLDNLDEAFESFRRGEPQRRAWVPNRYARYAPPGHEGHEDAKPIAIWLRFDQPVSGRRLLAVTESLRATVLERYMLDIAGAPETVPDVLTGHGFLGKGYHHAYYLALPSVGYRYARGTLHGAAVVLPVGTPAEVVEGVRACLWRVHELARPGAFKTRVRLYGGEDRPLAATPARWTKPGWRWVSATPVVHERFERHGPTISEVARWCEHASVAARPVSCRTSTVPIGEGALSLAPDEVYRANKERRPYSHLEVVFDRPVAGPLVLGAGRQFGFGLMYPVGGSNSRG